MKFKEEYLMKEIKHLQDLLDSALNELDERNRLYEHLEEEFNEYKEYVRDNYKMMTTEELIGE